MRFEIQKSESNVSLGDFLKDKLNVSGKAVRRLMESGACKVNGRYERFASYRLGTGDVIEVTYEEKKASSKHAFEQKRVLYEDDYLLTYNKPAGLNTDEKGILPIIKTQFPNAELVHRLDQGTTGVLLIAKDKKYLSKLETLFKTREVKKSYLAIVDGVIKKQSGYIENYLGELKRYSGQVIWGEVKENGLLSVTAWEVKSVGKDVTLVKCYPETGRTHQIRVHMSGMGHPLLGDRQYGKTFVSTYNAPRVMLHAESLEFTHPITNKPVLVIAPIPCDFQEALNTLHLVD
jgi:RluA family pseudouridine synthase